MAIRMILLGAPGAGKGTQAIQLAEHHGLPHISTGDIFREVARKGGELGLQIDTYLNKGHLVPDALTCSVVAQRLAQDDCQNGYVLDGFPRSVPQAEELERLLAGRGEHIDLAVNIAVADDHLVERLTARRTCLKCGKIYNLKFGPMSDDGCCANAECNGAKLTQREDDKEVTIRARLGVYHRTTEPLMAFYGHKGVLREVNGATRNREEVAQQIEALITALGAA